MNHTNITKQIVVLLLIACFPILCLVARAQGVPSPGPESPAQPIPYSHKKHLVMGLLCKDCHTNPEPGDRMTFPAESKCMTCHSTVAKEKPPIQKLTDYAKSGEPIPWVRVYVLPGWVYWSHRSHIEAQMTCEMCHGKLAEMDVTTRVTDVTKMAGCIECHRKNEASTGCRFCHEDK